VTITDFLIHREVVSSEEAAETIIGWGSVTVNDVVENSPNRKLKFGDVVEFAGKKYHCGGYQMEKYLTYEDPPGVVRAADPVVPLGLVELLKADHIDIRPGKLGGKPCLAGHRIGVGQLIAELLEEAEAQVKSVADNYNLDEDELMAMYQEVAWFFGQYWGRNGKP
jgi:uncharacterized protein (DUF433 family)/ribosome-associated protein YbcJ (S4-like RNA binding protein)